MVGEPVDEAAERHGQEPPLPDLVQRSRGLLFRNDVMSKAPWHHFKHLQPRAHLLVGLMPPDLSFGTGEMRAVQNVVLRLIGQQRPSGRYSATVVRDAGRPEMYFAFENEADAKGLAALVKAKATRLYPGWASQQAFRLDGPAVSAIEASLPPPKSREKPARGDELTVGYRIRRGSRARSKPSD
jgi:hypothetical protein